MISLFDRVENTVGKGEKCWSPAFSPFPTVFSKAFFFKGRLKSGLCGKELKSYRTIPLSNDPERKTLENIVEKICFLSDESRISYLSSANAFNFASSKIVLIWKELINLTSSK